MPRFFFDLSDQGIVQVDEEGIEFPDLSRAVESAKRAAVELMGEAIPGKAMASVTITVRDGPDTPVVTVLVRAETSPEVVFHRPSNRVP